MDRFDQEFAKLKWRKGEYKRYFEGRKNFVTEKDVMKTQIFSPFYFEDYEDEAFLKRKNFLRNLPNQQIKGKKGKGKKKKNKKPTVKKGTNPNGTIPDPNKTDDNADTTNLKNCTIEMEKNDTNELTHSKELSSGTNDVIEREKTENELPVYRPQDTFTNNNT